MLHTVTWSWSQHNNMLARSLVCLSVHLWQANRIETFSPAKKERKFCHFRKLLLLLLLLLVASIHFEPIAVSFDILSVSLKRYNHVQVNTKQQQPCSASGFFDVFTKLMFREQMFVVANLMFALNPRELERQTTCCCCCCKFVILQSKHQQQHQK